MTNTYIVYAIVAVLAAYITWDKALPRIKSLLSSRNSQTKATIDLKLAIEKLTESLNSDESTKILAGTLKACEAIASATVELRDSIAAFGKLVTVDDKQYPADQITQPPDRAADEKVATFLEAIARGRSVDDAKQEAKDRDETKTMFSAVTMDPMGDSQ